MKNLLSLACGFMLCTTIAKAQGLQPPPPDKAVVYIVRTSSLGFLINFTYFDSTKIIAKFAGTNYLRYECNPGYHLLWGRSENRDFVEANLEAGKIYFLDAEARMGAVKAAIRLMAVDPNDPTEQKLVQRILKLINKKPATVLDPADAAMDYADVIARGLEKFQQEKNSGTKHEQITPTMAYTVQ